jgi:hypothetical protein
MERKMTQGATLPERGRLEPETACFVDAGFRDCLEVRALKTKDLLFRD